MDKEPQTPDEPEEGNVWVNIGKLVLLVAILAAAWLVLERLIGGK